MLPEDGDENEQMVRFNTASTLPKKVYCESETNYGNVAHSCLFWSGKVSLCLGGIIFEERVLDPVISSFLEVLSYIDRVRTI
ncbi:hypothetical protein BJX96DRAFT_151144 [Aspergillus floccosus]